MSTTFRGHINGFRTGSKQSSLSCFTQSIFADVGGVNTIYAVDNGGINQFDCSLLNGVPNFSNTYHIASAISDMFKLVLPSFR